MVKVGFHLSCNHLCAIIVLILLHCACVPGGSAIYCEANDTDLQNDLILCTMRNGDNEKFIKFFFCEKRKMVFVNVCNGRSKYTQTA